MRRDETRWRPQKTKKRQTVDGDAALCRSASPRRGRPTVAYLPVPRWPGKLGARARASLNGGRCAGWPASNWAEKFQKWGLPSHASARRRRRCASCVIVVSETFAEQKTFSRKSACAEQRKSCGTGGVPIRGCGRHWSLVHWDISSVAVYFQQKCLKMGMQEPHADEWLRAPESLARALLGAKIGARFTAYKPCRLGSSQIVRHV